MAENKQILQILVNGTNVKIDGNLFLLLDKNFNFYKACIGIWDLHNYINSNIYFDEDTLINLLESGLYIGFYVRQNYNFGRPKLYQQYNLAEVRWDVAISAGSDYNNCGNLNSPLFITENAPDFDDERIILCTDPKLKYKNLQLAIFDESNVIDLPGMVEFRAKLYIAESLQAEFAEQNFNNKTSFVDILRYITKKYPYVPKQIKSAN